MPFLRLPINSHRCSFSHCGEKIGLKVLPKKKRIEVLRKYKLFVSKRAAICAIHAESNYFEWISCRQNGIDQFTQVQLKEIIALLSWKECGLPSVLSPEFNVSDYDIGISAEHFNQLLNSLNGLRNTLKSEKKCQIALTAYLTRLRTGDFLYRLQKTFNISYETLKKYLNAARKSLLSDFVPKHLGISNVTREKLIERTTIMANKLFNENSQVILIADATYIFYEKSKNYQVQRSTYSDQKKRNFVKPMVLTTTDGYYFDVIGPYTATANDAVILKHVMEHSKFSQLRTGDVFLLDRGFTPLCLTKTK